MLAMTIDEGGISCSNVRGQPAPICRGLGEPLGSILCLSSESAWIKCIKTTSPTLSCFFHLFGLHLLNPISVTSFFDRTFKVTHNQPRHVFLLRRKRGAGRRWVHRFVRLVGRVVLVF